MGVDADKPLRRDQSLADYAAIGLAPVLIFLMLSSLAGFLMQLLYQGNYHSRVMYIVSMYTMGATAVARITIEQSRNYASAYAVALGGATFISMLRFVGDPIFSIVVILVIGVLADRIVHDCTIVDEGVDSSGQGLIDSGRLFFGGLKNRMSDSTESKKSNIHGRHGHQPGRTVLYLAFAALPMFGIGQFMLRGGSDAWAQARWYLTLYLFSSLSLLVVTAFLNLRRYLRQRNTEMPWQVTGSWLAGGMTMILVILLVAYLAPLPGRALASIELPDFLTNSDPLSASQYGWGDEAAEEGQSGDQATDKDQREDAKSPEDAEGSSTRTEKGAPPGGEKGQRESGPAGEESGGKQKGGEQPSEQQSKQPQGSDQKQAKSGGNQPGDQGENQQQSQEQPQNKTSEQPEQSNANPSKSPTEKSKSSAKQQESSGDNRQSDGPSPDRAKGGEQRESGEQSDSTKSQPEQDSSAQNKSEPGQEPGRDGEKPSSDPSESSGKQNAEQGDEESKDGMSGDQDSDSSESENEGEQNGDEQTGGENENDEEKENGNEDGGEERNENPTEPASERSSSDWSGLFGWLGTLLKFLIFLGLLAVITTYVYLNRAALLAWWENLFGARENAEGVTNDSENSTDQAKPVKTFAEFRNPVGQHDSSKVVVITFQALEAWAREQGLERASEETPTEFSGRLVRQFPHLHHPALRVIDAYNRVVFGKTVASEQDVQAASSVWSLLRPS